MRELDIERIALIGRAVSDPNRIVILLKLENGDMTTQEIMDSMDINQSNLSYHMSKLLKADLVSCRRIDGRHIYGLTDSGSRMIGQFKACCRRVPSNDC